MRYWTCAKPPAAIGEAYGISVEHLGEVTVPWDIGNATESAVETANRCRRLVIEQSYEGFWLKNVMNDAIVPVKDNRDWWVAWGQTFARVVATMGLPVRMWAVDHARYPGRRNEQDWILESIVRPLREACEPVGGVVGMFGLSMVDAPTMWTTPKALVDDAGHWPLAVERGAPWLMMPGQYRNALPRPTTPEFLSNVFHMRDLGYTELIVWSDPRDDAFGRPKTKPQDWHGLLTAAALMEGRAVDVREWSPPSWLPVIEEEPEVREPNRRPLPAEDAISIRPVTIAEPPKDRPTTPDPADEP